MSEKKLNAKSSAANTCRRARADGCDDGAGPPQLQVAQSLLSVNAHVRHRSNVPEHACDV